MTIRPEILKWSKSRPAWQQDALRRLVEKTKLDTTDIEDLVALCCIENGIDVEDAPAPVPLSGPNGDVVKVDSGDVRLRAIRSVQGVNVLRADQELSLSTEGLTVVYGDNASGKSGYVRLLKQVCRARGAKETIHPNVYSEDAAEQSAIILYDIDGVDREASWGMNAAVGVELGQVSVFDTRSAAVYLGTPNSVAYLPRGMDLFPRLVAVLEAVKSSLEQRIAILQSERDRFPEIQIGTKVFEFVHNLGSSSSTALRSKLQSFTDDDALALAAKKKEYARLTADDPAGRAKALRLQVNRLAQLRKFVSDTGNALVPARKVELAELRNKLRVAADAAALASQNAFADAPLAGVASEVWRSLWSAARDFAEHGAVPAQTFPTPAGSPCLLCQQDIDEQAAARLQRFEEYVRSSTQKAADSAATAVLNAEKKLEAIQPELGLSRDLSDELELIDASLLADVQTTLSRLQHLRDAYLGRREMPDDDSATGVRVESGLTRLIEAISTEAIRYEEASRSAATKAVAEEIAELEARKTLVGLRERVEAQVARELRIGQLKKAVEATRTNAVTSMSRQLLDDEVLAPLSTLFVDEVNALRLTHIPIALAGSHAEKGRAYHSVEIVRRKERVPPGEILSEGEQRSIALAAFLAEVAQQESKSTLVFDDPVSSLDHERREYVAGRLAAIAQRRPVVVFTHDFTFLWMMQEAAMEAGVPIAQRMVRRDGTGAGIVATEWPWHGQSVNKRLGTLKQEAVRLKKLEREARSEYEKEVVSFYGRLRATWERAVEDVLLNGAIHRFEKEVHTKPLRGLHRVKADHVTRLEAGMKRCSNVTEAHDRARGLGSSYPVAAEVDRDLGALVEWVKEVNAIHSAKGD